MVQLQTFACITRGARLRIARHVQTEQKNSAPALYAGDRQSRWTYLKVLKWRIWSVNVKQTKLGIYWTAWVRQKKEIEIFLYNLRDNAGKPGVIHVFYHAQLSVRHAITRLLRSSKHSSKQNFKKDFQECRTPMLIAGVCDTEDSLGVLCTNCCVELVSFLVVEMLMVSVFLLLWIQCQPSTDFTSLPRQRPWR